VSATYLKLAEGGTRLVLAEDAAFVAEQARRAEVAALQLSTDPIAAEPKAVLRDDDGNLIAVIGPDTIDHPHVAAIERRAGQGIAAARPLRAPSTPYASDIPFTGLTHLLKFGQSNSVNTAEALGLAAYAVPAMMFNGGVHTRRAFADNATEATTGPTRTSMVPLRETGRETGMGPAIEMMCQLLRDEDGIDLSTSDLALLGSSAGVGGQTIQALASTYYFRVLEDFAAAKDLADAAGRGYSVAGLLYNGNESNQLNTPPTLAGSPVATTVDNFLAVLREMQVKVQTDAQAESGQTWPVPMFLVQTNTHLSTASGNYTNANAFVARAQLAAGVNADAVNPNIVFCGPSYQFGLAADGVHFTAEGGAVRDALIGIAMKRVFFDKVKPKPMAPTITRHGKTLRLTFPKGPFGLVWDTVTVAAQTNYGFRVFNGAIGVGAAEAISTPRIVAPNVVEIGCTNTPAAGWEVDYAIATSTGGTRGLGNLRDNQGDAIVFAPDRWNAPMHNWCPAFRSIAA